MGGQEVQPPPYEDLDDCLSFSPPETDIGKKKLNNTKTQKNINKPLTSLNLFF